MFLFVLILCSSFCLLVKLANLNWVDGALSMKTSKQSNGIVNLIHKSLCMFILCVCAFICFLKSYSEFCTAPFASTLTSSEFGAVPNMESREPSNFPQNWNVWLQNGTNIGILGRSVEFESNVPLNVDFTRQNYDNVLNFSGANASLIFA